jgi:hypothetical protein
MMGKLRASVRVQSVEFVEGFKVRVVFQNGDRKEVDLEPFLHGPVFETIRSDPKVFRSIKVVGRTIGWDNGADIDPDVLYQELKPASNEGIVDDDVDCQLNDEWKSKRFVTIEDRQVFMRLSREQRYRLLEMQAERMASHYESEQETREREEWQGGDIVEL